MIKLLYEIEMQTLIGIKHGTMYAEILHDEVKGFLNLMKQSTAFCGNIDINGKCKIQGKIISLTKTIPYQVQIPVDWCVHSRISGAPILK